MHDIAHAAADAARLPDFADVLARGERRRKARYAVTAGAAALTVVAIIGATQLLGTNTSEAPEPAPSPPTTVIDDERSENDPLELIVDDPDALVGDAAVNANGVTAVLWRVVNREQWGLAVSADGFVTRHLARLPIPGDVFTAGDAFLVRDQAMSKVWVVGPGGDWTRVEVDGSEAPVVDGEVPVSTSGGLIAVNPATARAHPVDAPEGAWRIDLYGGRLTAITAVVGGTGQRDVTYHWSDDGGASWQSASFDAGTTWSPEVIPTAAGSEHVIAILSDGATIGPLAAVLTMPAGGSGFTETPYDGELASFSGAWVVDGEIRFLGDLWGSGSGPPRESGVYRWIDGRLELIPSSAPDVTDVADSTLVDVVDTDGGPTLLIAVGERLFQSTDGGATWSAIASR